MITAEALRSVETSGSLDAATFSIKSGGKAFGMLISGLYSNKIKSIIRETCSNAFDSHIRAGISDRPFKLTLPSLFEPQFSVRDYGVSMTHEQVMHHLTTLFDSSKDQSDDEVGGFGLGAKVPFAYTDTFAWTCWLDGEARLYNAYLGADGVPRIDLLMRQPSDEPSGVEVSFPVKESDIKMFATEAAVVAFAFPVRPECGNTLYISTLNALDATIKMRGEGFLMAEREYQHNELKLSVRQGCVDYPVELQHIPHDRDLVRSLTGHHLYLQVPIGSVKPTPSREQLEFIDSTKVSIQAALERAFDGIRANLKTRLHGVPMIDILRRSMPESSFIERFGDFIEWPYHFGQSTRYLKQNNKAIVTRVLKRHKVKTFYFTQVESIGSYGGCFGAVKIGTADVNLVKGDQVCIYRLNTEREDRSLTHLRQVIFYSSEDLPARKTVLACRAHMKAHFRDLDASQFLLATGVPKGVDKLLWHALGRPPLEEFRVVNLDEQAIEDAPEEIDVQILKVATSQTAKWMRSMSTRALLNDEMQITWLKGGEQPSIFGAMLSRSETVSLSVGFAKYFGDSAKHATVVVAPTKVEEFLAQVGSRAVSAEDRVREISDSLSKEAWQSLASESDVAKTWAYWEGSNIYNVREPHISRQALLLDFTEAATEKLLAIQALHLERLHWQRVFGSICVPKKEQCLFEFRSKKGGKTLGFEKAFGAVLDRMKRKSPIVHALATRALYHNTTFINTDHQTVEWRRRNYVAPWVADVLNKFWPDQPVSEETAAVEVEKPAAEIDATPAFA